MKSNRGFSLLETLLYLGIFAIVGGSLFGILTNVVRISTKEVSGDEVASQLNFTMTTLNRLVRESSNIETATTTATTTLKLRMVDPLKDPTCVILSGGVLKLAEGPDPFQEQNCTSTTTDITTNKVVVDRALFRKAEFPGAHDQILLDLQFSNLASGSSKISRVLRSGISRVSAATFDSDLLPNADAQHEVGSVTPSIKRWKNISISGLLNLGTNISDPAGVDGSVYYNSTSDTFRGKANGVWADLGSTLWKATSTNMYSNITGNIGIGTQSPGAKLDIAASGDGAMALRFSTERPWVIRQTSTGPSAALDLHSTASDKSFKVTSLGGNRAAEFLVSDTAGNNKVYLVPEGGSVGIGTATPTNKLYVGAIANSNDGINIGDVLRLRNSSAGNNFVIEHMATTGHVYLRSFSGGDTSGDLFINDIGGNVGIGTTSPGQKLDVNGGIAGTTLIAGTGGITLNGVNRTTWPASPSTPQVFSKAVCMSATYCLIAGVDKVYAFYVPGNVTYPHAAPGVNPESTITCISTDACVIAGTDKTYAYFGAANQVYLQNTPGTVPQSKSVAIGTSVALIPGTDKTYAYFTSSNAVYLQSTPGTFPGSTITCASNNTCVIVGWGNSYSYFVSSNAVYQQNTAESR